MSKINLISGITIYRETLGDIVGRKTLMTSGASTI
jgi:hypothetical protein